MKQISDEEFIATVADPVRRSTAIAGIIKQHKRLSWIVVIITLGFFALNYFSSKPPNGILVLVIFLPWMQFYKCESDLRLLRVIERLQNQEKPVA
jgi:hypothetical protein